MPKNGVKANTCQTNLAPKGRPGLVNGDKKLDKAGPRSCKQMGSRGLGKAGAKRLGQMLRKAIQQKEGLQGTAGTILPKTPVGLLKHQADVIAKATENAKRKVPRVSELILQVIAQCKSQGGITMAELKMALAANGYDVTKNQTQVNKAMKGLVKTDTLLKTSSRGTLEAYKFNTKGVKTRASHMRGEPRTPASLQGAAKVKAKTKQAVVKKKQAPRARVTKRPARASPVKRGKKSPKKRPATGRAKKPKRNTRRR